MTTAEARRRVTDMQAHYAESGLEAVRSLVPYLASLEERVAAVTPANAPANIAYRMGALQHDLRMARYSAAACVAAMARETHPSHLDYSRKDEPVI